jgi:hypothetical protein
LPSLWKAGTHPRNGFEEGVRVSSPPRLGRPAVSPRLSGIRSPLPRLPEGIGLRHQSNCRLRLHPSLPGQRHKIRLPIAVPPCIVTPSEVRLSSWGLPLRVPQVPVLYLGSWVLPVPCRGGSTPPSVASGYRQVSTAPPLRARFFGHSSAV